MRDSKLAEGSLRLSTDTKKNKKIIDLKIALIDISLFS